jgi:hypothetical protein
VAKKMDKQNSTYFTTEALARMVAVQGKTVERIIIVLWQNVVDANNSLEVIDALQLRFTDGEKITFGCNDNSNGIDVVDYHYKETREQLEAEFGEKIKLHALDASKTKMWEDVPGKILKTIRLTKEDGHYKSDSLILDLGEERREVSISPYDGLVIDYHEED